MPKRARSRKRERQYEHNKEGLVERGREVARVMGIEGRSTMSRAELERAVGRS